MAGVYLVFHEGATRRRRSFLPKMCFDTTVAGINISRLTSFPTFILTSLCR